MIVFFICCHNGADYLCWLKCEITSRVNYNLTLSPNCWKLDVVLTVPAELGFVESLKTARYVESCVSQMSPNVMGSAGHLQTLVGETWKYARLLGLTCRDSRLVFSQLDSLALTSCSVPKLDVPCIICICTCTCTCVIKLEKLKKHPGGFHKFTNFVCIICSQCLVSYLRCSWSPSFHVLKHDSCYLLPASHPLIYILKATEFTPPPPVWFAGALCSHVQWSLHNQNYQSDFCNHQTYRVTECWKALCFVLFQN